MIKPKGADWSTQWFICRKCLQFFLGDRVFLDHKMACNVQMPELTRVEDQDGEEYTPEAETGHRERSLSPPDLSDSCYGSPPDSEEREEKKQFECDHCHRNFALNFHLKRHLQTHVHKETPVTSPSPPTVDHSPQHSGESHEETTLHRSQHALSSHESWNHSVGESQNSRFEEDPRQFSPSTNQDQVKPVSKSHRRGRISQSKLQRGKASLIQKLIQPGRRLLKCAFCPSAYRSTKDFSHHVRIHIGDAEDVPNSKRKYRTRFVRRGELRVPGALNPVGQFSKRVFMPPGFMPAFGRKMDIVVDNSEIPKSQP